MAKYKGSILIDDLDTCLVCGTTIGLHIHHVFGASNRKKSTKYRLVVPLCGRHHNMSNQGIHFNRTLDLKIKQMAQKKAMEYYNWTIEDFRGVFGKSWL